MCIRDSLYPFLSLLFLHAFRQGGTKYRTLLILYLACTALPSLQCLSLIHISFPEAVPDRVPA